MKQPQPSDKSQTAFDRLMNSHGGTQASLADRLDTPASNVTRWARNGLPRAWAEHAHLHYGFPYEPGDYQ